MSGSKDEVVGPERQISLASWFGVDDKDSDYFWSHSKGHGLHLTKPETRELVEKIRALAASAP